MLFLKQSQFAAVLFLGIERTGIGLAGIGSFGELFLKGLEFFVFGL